MKVIIKASTPEQFQQNIVEWLKGEAVRCRGNAKAIASTKKGEREYEAFAKAYDSAATFISELTIEQVELNK